MSQKEETWVHSVDPLEGIYTFISRASLSVIRKDMLARRSGDDINVRYGLSNA